MDGKTYLKMDGQKIINIALVEVGYTEFPANSNHTKYGEWANLNGLAWCGLFVSWSYEKAGFQLPKIGFSFHGFAGCQTAYDYFKKNKWITLKPVIGDIILFDWNKDGRYDHTGLFIKDVGNGFFESVEGNTSGTNQSNGGEVQRRLRKYSDAIFIHPKI